MMKAKNVICLIFIAIVALLVLGCKPKVEVTAEPEVDAVETDTSSIESDIAEISSDIEKDLDTSDLDSLDEALSDIENLG